MCQDFLDNLYRSISPAPYFCTPTLSRYRFVSRVILFIQRMNQNHTCRYFRFKLEPFYKLSHSGSTLAERDTPMLHTDGRARLLMENLSLFGRPSSIHGASLWFSSDVWDKRFSLPDSPHLEWFWSSPRAPRTPMHTTLLQPKKWRVVDSIP